MKQTRHGKTNITCSFSHMETKTKQLESRIVINRDWEGCQVVGEDGRKVVRDDQCVLYDGNITLNPIN